MLLAWALQAQDPIFNEEVFVDADDACAPSFRAVLGCESSGNARECKRRHCQT